MRFRWLARTIALVSTAAILGAACGGSTPGGNGGPSGQVIKGGKIVLGAEQYPECINPITLCASASWLFWDTTVYLFPRPVLWRPDGQVEASPLITSCPAWTTAT